jgi:hypothetical protein
MNADDLWCTICDRGAEGCMHPIELPDELTPERLYGEDKTKGQVTG